MCIVLVYTGWYACLCECNRAILVGIRFGTNFTGAQERGGLHNLPKLAALSQIFG